MVNKMVLAGLGALAVVVAVMSDGGVMSEAVADDDRLRTLTVSAEGDVEVVPDMAVVRAGVETTSATAEQALEDNSRAMTRVIDALKAKGFAPRDLGTSSFNVQPEYDRSKSRAAQAPSIVGYRVSNILTIVIRELKQVGPVLDEVIRLGANQLHGLSFVVSDADEKLDAARREAVVAARKRAELYATAAGVTLKRIVTISESGTASPRPMMASRRTAAMAEAVPVEPGAQELTARVTVVWEIE